MNQKDKIQELFDDLVFRLESQGLDLLVDSASLSLTYPHKPGVMLYISIGSMFDETPHDEEEETLH